MLNVKLQVFYNPDYNLPVNLTRLIFHLMFKLRFQTWLNKTGWQIAKYLNLIRFFFHYVKMLVFLNKEFTSFEEGTCFCTTELKTDGTGYLWARSHGIGQRRSGVTPARRANLITGSQWAGDRIWIGGRKVWFCENRCNVRMLNKIIYCRLCWKGGAVSDLL